MAGGDYRSFRFSFPCSDVVAKIVENDDLRQ